tara:strand:+ start:484 stop:714 length:231 start_codon:yes stop_codon:yes gene_type:complete
MNTSLILGIIASVFIGLLIIHYIYTNWNKFQELRRSWQTRTATRSATTAPMPTVQATYVENIPPDAMVVTIIQPIT